MHILRKKILSFWTVNFFGWLILYLGTLLMYLAGNTYKGKGLFDFDYLGYSITYVVGFSVSIILRYLYRKIDVRKVTFGRLAIIIFAATLFFANLWFFIDLVVSMPLHGASNMLLKVSKLHIYIEAMFYHTMPLLSWSALYFGIKFWRDWDVQKKRAEQANSLAQSAQLQMLRYQLNPHFLFNSLNSIRALIDEDKKNAKNMITELSEFLRYSLISKNYSDVPLIDEIEAIEYYFSIEKKRFEEKLDVTINVEPLAEDYPVLSFLIHPLTENAIKYGMQTSELPLKISVIAKVRNNKLLLEVCNSGKWIDPQEHNNSNSTGTGLKNVQLRLQNAFPDAHEFRIEKNENNVCVKIEIEKKLS